jgi:hypothetical protein
MNRQICYINMKLILINERWRIRGCIRDIRNVINLNGTAL